MLCREPNAYRRCTLFSADRFAPQTITLKAPKATLPMVLPCSAAPDDDGVWSSALSSVRSSPLVALVRAHVRAHAIPQRTRRPSRFRREPPAREKRVLAIPQRAAHNFQEAIRASLLDAIPRPLD